MTVKIYGQIIMSSRKPEGKKHVTVSKLQTKQLNCIIKYQWGHRNYQGINMFESIAKKYIN